MLALAHLAAATDTPPDDAPGLVNAHEMIAEWQGERRVLSAPTMRFEQWPQTALQVSRWREVSKPDWVTTPTGRPHAAQRRRQAARARRRVHDAREPGAAGGAAVVRAADAALAGARAARVAARGGVHARRSRGALGGPGGCVQPEPHAGRVRELPLVDALGVALSDEVAGRERRLVLEDEARPDTAIPVDALPGTVRIDANDRIVGMPPEHSPSRRPRRRPAARRRRCRARAATPTSSGPAGSASTRSPTAARRTARCRSTARARSASRRTATSWRSMARATPARGCA